MATAPPDALLQSKLVSYLSQSWQVTLKVTAFGDSSTQHFEGLYDTDTSRERREADMMGALSSSMRYGR